MFCLDLFNSLESLSLSETQKVVSYCTCRIHVRFARVFIRLGRLARSPGHHQPSLSLDATGGAVYRSVTRHAVAVRL